MDFEQEILLKIEELKQEQIILREQYETKSLSKEDFESILRNLIKEEKEYKQKLEEEKKKKKIK